MKRKTKTCELSGLNSELVKFMNVTGSILNVIIYIIKIFIDKIISVLFMIAIG